jgi:hypothetical protein
VKRRAKGGEGCDVLGDWEETTKCAKEEAGRAVRNFTGWAFSIVFQGSK